VRAALPGWMPATAPAGAANGCGRADRRAWLGLLTARSESSAQIPRPDDADQSPCRTRTRHSSRPPWRRQAIDKRRPTAHGTPPAPLLDEGTVTATTPILHSKGQGTHPPIRHPGPEFVQESVARPPPLRRVAASWQDPPHHIALPHASRGLGQGVGRQRRNALLWWRCIDVMYIAHRRRDDGNPD